MKYQFDGNGTAEDPFLIENLNIKNKIHTTDGAIEIRDTTFHFIIRNCRIWGYTMVNIRIAGVGDGTAKLINNNIDGSKSILGYTHNGIACYRTDEAIISNNEISFCGNAIDMESCHSSVIENNTCLNNQYGAYIRYCDSLLVQNNNFSLNQCGYRGSISKYTIIHNNEFLGRFSSESPGTGRDMLGPAIWIYAGDSSSITNNTCSFYPDIGVYLDRSPYSNISYNILCDNRGTETGMGIRLSNSNFSRIFYNSISYNEAVGASITNSYNNTIHHNAFVNNGNGVEDHATEYNSDFNNWYDILLLEGNFWSSWGYLIPFPITNSNSTDPYPLSSNPLT